MYYLSIEAGITVFGYSVLETDIEAHNLLRDSHRESNIVPFSIII